MTTALPEATAPEATAPEAVPSASGGSRAHVINLSSGAIPPPRAPEPAPPPIPASGESRGHGGVFTVNLASASPEGSRPRRARKVAAAPALITQTINLSTRKTDEQKAAERERAKETKPPEKASGARGQKPRGQKTQRDARGQGPKNQSRPNPRRQDNAGGRRDDARGNSQAPSHASSASSLAELLDPEVLKKLRGG